MVDPTTAMAVKVLVVLAVLIAKVFSYDLSGIRVEGNQFVNHANQTVILTVRSVIIAAVQLLCYKRFCAWTF